MNIEHEVKVLDIDFVSVTQGLKKIGAKKVSSELQKRYVFNVPGSAKKDQKWLRLRTNGKQTTLALKQIEDDSIKGTKEWEIEVAGFETMLGLLKQLGFQPKGYQENRRTEYIKGKVSLCIDEWPKIPPYLEIEGPNPKSVLRVAKEMGFSPKDLTSINTMKIYKLYGLDIEKYKRLTF